MANHAAIDIENITRRFGAVIALDRVSLAIPQGEYFSLLGPSGCGKTTLLRIIAGLDAPDGGTLRIDGKDAGGVAAHRRPVNTVFQSYALFPHLTVWENIAFGLRMKKVAGAQIGTRVQEVMALVEVEDLARRRPSQLSGGQKQRVALARALVNEPRVLLLDEPLAALDLKLRKQLQVELRNLQRRLGITFIHVTHDQEEALVLSDRIAVMRDGRIEQVGAAQDLYERPKTRFTSQFLGSCSLIDATVKSADGKGMLVETTLRELRVPGDAPCGRKLTLAIRPEKVQLSAEEPRHGENIVRVRIDQVIYVGGQYRFELRAGPQALHAEVMNTEGTAPGLSAGKDAWAFLPPTALIILDD